MIFFIAILNISIISPSLLSPFRCSSLYMSGASHLEMAHPPLLITLVSSSYESVCVHMCVAYM